MKERMPSATTGVRIAASILSADFARLGEQIKEADSAGADSIHIDVMDGHFVPGLTIGSLVVEAIRPYTKLPFEAHLMIESPERFVREFAEAGADLITVHQEACVHLQRVVEQIKGLNKRAGVAINPATPIGTLEEILPFVDLVLVMTVNPGHGGQSFIATMPPKIAAMRDMIDERQLDVELEVDGGIHRETAPCARGRACSLRGRRSSTRTMTWRRRSGCCAKARAHQRTKAWRKHEPELDLSARKPVMRVGIAADHEAFALKEQLAACLKAAGHEVADFGAHVLTAGDDYPDYVAPLSKAVAGGEVERGIAICGSGVGACVTANKVQGVRAALCHDHFSAHQGVEDDDMNVLCLGSGVVGPALARELIQTFLAARFSGAERHRRRLAKVAALDGYEEKAAAPKGGV